MALCLPMAVTQSRRWMCLGKPSPGNGHIPSCDTGGRAVQHPLHRAASHLDLEKAKSGRKYRHYTSRHDTWNRAIFEQLSKLSENKGRVKYKT